MRPEGSAAAAGERMGLKRKAPRRHGESQDEAQRREEREGVSRPPGHRQGHWWLGVQREITIDEAEAVIARSRDQDAWRRGQQQLQQLRLRSCPPPGDTTAAWPQSLPIAVPPGISTRHSSDASATTRQLVIGRQCGPASGTLRGPTLGAAPRGRIEVTTAHP